LRTAIAILSLIVTLGLLAIPPALLAALIRGGIRERRQRESREGEIGTFD